MSDDAMNIPGPIAPPPSTTNARTQLVHIRPEDEVAAMSWNQRMRKRVSNILKVPTTTTTATAAGGEDSLVGGSSNRHVMSNTNATTPNLNNDANRNNRNNNNHNNNSIGQGDEEASHTTRTVNPQYRLEAATNARPQKQGLVRKYILCGCGTKRYNGSSLETGVNPNQQLAQYLHWMFRVNFVFLFIVMCVTFFALVILFSGFITMAGRMDAQCVRIGGEEFAASGTPFADAFALSWTTFSTVGYGNTYPALGHQNNSPTNCFFINFICSFEALVGVLYAGFCGAILFGKVLRIQSHAQVLFSDPLLIRYGKGAMPDDGLSSGTTNRGGGDTSHTEDDNSIDTNQGKAPFPVLEFRIVNRLFNETGGEIMDASLNVVANIDANDADPALRDVLESSSNGHYTGSYFSNPYRSLHYSSNTSVDNSVSDEVSSLPESTRSEGNLRNLSRFLYPAFGAFSLRPSSRDHQVISEDPSARLVSKHIFSKMMIEASDHPFFKRVWLARHVLDDHSPILKPRVRRQIRRNGGVWPEKLNSAAAIRGSLQFNQILVSLNGVSNISASNVYAQKIYDFVDVNIGYQFVNILYRESDGTLGVDLDLINDVREQNGGGGESLMGEEGEAV